MTGADVQTRERAGGCGVSKHDPWIDEAREWLAVRDDAAKVDGLAELLANYALVNRHHQALKQAYDGLLAESARSTIETALRGKFKNSRIDGDAVIVTMADGYDVRLEITPKYSGIHVGWKRDTA